MPGVPLKMLHQRQPLGVDRMARVALGATTPEPSCQTLSPDDCEGASSG